MQAPTQGSRRDVQCISHLGLFALTTGQLADDFGTYKPREILAVQAVQVLDDHFFIQFGQMRIGRRQSNVRVFGLDADPVAWHIIVNVTVEVLIPGAGVSRAWPCHLDRHYFKMRPIVVTHHLNQCSGGAVVPHYDVSGGQVNHEIKYQQAPLFCQVQAGVAVEKANVALPALARISSIFR